MGAGGDPDGQDDEEDWRTAYLDDDDRPKTYGQRLWVNKRGRAILNEASAQLLRTAPDYVDDPADPSSDELLEFIQRDYKKNREVVPLIIDFLRRGLTYQEAVVWYLWDYSEWDLNELYYVSVAPVEDGDGDDRRIETGGHAADRRNAKRTLRAVLHSAASKLGVDPPTIEDDAITDETS